VERAATSDSAAAGRDHAQLESPIRQQWQLSALSKVYTAQREQLSNPEEFWCCLFPNFQAIPVEDRWFGKAPIDLPDYRPLRQTAAAALPVQPGHSDQQRTAPNSAALVERVVSAERGSFARAVVLKP